MDTRRRRSNGWDWTSWELLILDEWAEIRGRRPQLLGLRRPNLAISDELTRTLGHWDAERRLITLSRRLLDPSRWGVLVAVLQHEMAHQVVTELLGEPDPRPHGAAFARACALVGIEASATASPELLERSSAEADGGVRRKIAKLLALAESPEPHEAEAALRKAHEIALRHNVGLLDAGAEVDYELRIVGEPMKRIPSWYWIILSILEEAYFVLYISRGCRQLDRATRGAATKVIEIYGTPDNVEAAAYVFDYLVAQATPLWERYRFRNGLTNQRRKLSFLRGLYAGFRETLRQRTIEFEERHALVWRGDPELRGFYRRRNPHVRKVSSGATNHYADAHAAGREEGRRLRIRPGVGGGSGGSGGIRGLLGSR